MMRNRALLPAADLFLVRIAGFAQMTGRDAREQTGGMPDNTQSWGLRKTKKAATFRLRPSQLGAWRCPTLTWGDPTLPSALSGFTSEFEMGSGGSYSLLPPGKPVEGKLRFDVNFLSN